MSTLLKRFQLKFVRNQFNALKNTVPILHPSSCDFSQLVGKEDINFIFLVENPIDNSREGDGDVGQGTLR